MKLNPGFKFRSAQRLGFAKGVQTSGRLKPRRKGVGAAPGGSRYRRDCMWPPGVSRECAITEKGVQPRVTGYFQVTTAFTILLLQPSVPISFLGYKGGKKNQGLIFNRGISFAL